ncbi:hypothetical protein AAFG07_32465 [Bradyrhizobium sp. B097]|uniref:hypothetical protein n=1 Tax=Bradyrhizobium sp. B097 TaxID=3140244 RepID=UPI003183D3F1
MAREPAHQTWTTFLIPPGADVISQGIGLPRLGMSIRARREDFMRPTLNQSRNLGQSRQDGLFHVLTKPRVRHGPEARRKDRLLASMRHSIAVQRLSITDFARTPSALGEAPADSSLLKIIHEVEQWGRMLPNETAQAVGQNVPQIT